MNTPLRTIKKLLVANRGEIALRVMRTAKEMGIATVAVYSEADRQSPHVHYADEAVLLGPPPSSESYLRADKIIEAALALGVDAIHPGYGFLSENASFSQMVEDAGMLFVGPSPHAIEVMGSKLAAKNAVKGYGTPLVPGMATALDNLEEAKAKCLEIGYPVLIKASAGGGGKGMRVVENEAEFDEQLERAVSEAKSSFGDSSVFIEKYITNPKHIEIQVLGDKHGNIIYLFERECSVQRRHQKVVEEAPSPVLTPEVREAMGKAAVSAAKSVNYYGAGTVEFVMDENLNFYFLEMNTRLQVEHPVTEMITGVDLVREMIRIAEGHPLSIKQEDLKIHGHSIEIRVYAEDPANNFMPDIGKLERYQRPAGPGIRVDDGFEEGMEIPIYYDPMIAKLIVHAGTREQAIARMLRAIADYKITGIQNTLGFCKFVLKHPDFISGKFTTGFVAQHYTPEVLVETLTDDALEVAAYITAQALSKTEPLGFQELPASTASVWKQERAEFRN
jgi:propionyl-CoA carboxylase alpha chain